MSIIRGLVPIVFLVALAALSTWYLRQIEDNLERQRSADSTAPRAFGTGVALTRLGADGLPRYTLEAAKMTQGPGTSGIDLLDPRYSGFESQRMTRRGSAERGWVADGHKLVKLYDSVRLEELDAGGGRPAVMSTSYLEIYPDDNVAQTSLPVEIATGTGIVNAVGMRADLGRDRVWLETKVRGWHKANADEATP